MHIQVKPVLLENNAWIFVMKMMSVGDVKRFFFSFILMLNKCQHLLIIYYLFIADFDPLNSCLCKKLCNTVNMWIHLKHMVANALRIRKKKEYIMTH